jgi:16S rRNA (cytosine967-C5)-methyltransferase
MSEPARDLALGVLLRVETKGAWASAALRAEIDRSPALDPRDKALATELVYGVLRRRLQLDRIVSQLGKRMKDLDPKIHDVLRLAAYQIVFLDRVPAHAAVNAAVEQAKARRGERGASQVNAILRNLSALTEKERMPHIPNRAKDAVGHIALSASLPRNLVERLIAQDGVDNLERPTLSLRANLLRTTRDALAEEVSGTSGLHPLSVDLDAPGLLPADLEAVVAGRATPQDVASMMVVDMLAPSPGETILDLCAAPGGKTTCIAECMKNEGRVLAHDVTKEKREEIERNRDRLGLDIIETIPLPPEPGAPWFDRVLIDAPCSGTGTLRRHPEGRWRFRVEDLAGLERTQFELLDRASTLVREGGCIVYSVCSVLRSEGADQVVAALARHPTLSLEAELRTGPEDEGAPDGFYAARLRRAG